MAAGTSIFTLMGEIFIDNEKANESIQKTESRAEKLGEGLKKGIGTAVKWGAALGTAAVAGGTALFAMANKAADTTDRIDKLSQKIGISRTAFQEYEYILSQNGTSVEVLQRGMKTLADRMDESVQGTGKGAEAFGKLKISATDLNGELKTAEQMFEEAAKALMDMPEGVEKSTLAFDLFGKAGQELMPLLNGTAEDMDALKAAAHDMGLVLSDDAIDAGAQFTDTMDNVKRSLGSVVANIGVQVMPMFQTFLDWVMDHMPEIQEIITKVFEYIGIFVNVAIDIFRDYLIPTFQAIFDWTKTNWPTIQTIIKGVFDGIKLVWDKVLQPVLTLLWDILKNIVKWTSDNWPTISKVFETVFNLVKGVWDNILEPVLSALWTILEGIFDFVKNVFSGIGEIFEKSFEVVGKAVETVTGIFTKLSDGIQKAWDWLNRWNKTPVEKKETSVSQDAGYSQVRVPSHRTGLDYVPYDGYVAELHKGEKVLTAEENKGTQGINNNFNISSLVVREEADVKKVAKELFDLQQRSNRGRGIVTV